MSSRRFPRDCAAGVVRIADGEAKNRLWKRLIQSLTVRQIRRTSQDDAIDMLLSIRRRAARMAPQRVISRRDGKSLHTASQPGGTKSAEPHRGPK